MLIKRLKPEEGLRVFDIKQDVLTAGPSTNNNKRTEIFLLGCKKALLGNPCKGCFNSITWDDSKSKFSREPLELADYIIKYSKNKYITIGGGEPTDQLHHLIPLLKKLKENGYHIIMYTWRDVISLLRDKENYKEPIYCDNFIEDFFKAIKYIDIIIDGEFILSERLWNPLDDNISHNFVGSANQKIIDINKGTYIEVGYIKNLSLDDNNELIYELYEGDNSYVRNI